jgi:hypothetical protein
MVTGKVHPIPADPQVSSIAHFDNIQILKAIDERQQQAEGRPLWISAHQLLSEISGTHTADPRLMPGFLQELFIAQAAGQLTWRLTNQNANPQDANYYLQQIQDLALTPAGQDRHETGWWPCHRPTLAKMMATT